MHDEEPGYTEYGGMVSVRRSDEKIRVNDHLYTILPRVTLGTTG